LMVTTEYLESAPGIAPGEVTAEAPLQSSSLAGKKVSHYRVLDVIGGGGMGMVFKAEDLKLGRLVALKFLPEEFAGDAVALKRFEREAQTASALNHPNICTIYEIEEHEGQPFIAMELLQGDNLRDRLSASKQKPLPLRELLEISAQICDGLQAAQPSDRAAAADPARSRSTKGTRIFRRIRYRGHRSALHQRDARIVPVHEQADAKTDGQEHPHDQRDGFDGLAGLVQRGIGDRHDVLIADRDGQR